MQDIDRDTEANIFAKIKSRIKYPWRKNGQRFDLVMIGEPDCYAYIIRYWSEEWKSSAWCWILTMPRCVAHGVCGPRYNGWARSPHEAKRQVEELIQREWQ